MYGLWEGGSFEALFQLCGGCRQGLVLNGKSQPIPSRAKIRSTYHSIHQSCTATAKLTFQQSFTQIWCFSCLSQMFTSLCFCRRVTRVLGSEPAPVWIKEKKNSIYLGIPSSRIRGGISARRKRLKYCHSMEGSAEPGYIFVNMCTEYTYVDMYELIWVLVAINYR